ncbi:MAG TPA: spore coat protein A, partial [Geobacter sp.]|nr:spore coat protein A [Geobacter sp.]
MVHSWFTPGFTEKGPLWESTRQFGPEGTYFYPMDQEAATIWYHDHSTGLTHNNTNMGMAGFFPITDANEKRLQGIGGPKYLPTGAQELGFALQ